MASLNIVFSYFSFCSRHFDCQLHICKVKKELSVHAGVEQRDPCESEQVCNSIAQKGSNSLIWTCNGHQ